MRDLGHAARAYLLLCYALGLIALWWLVGNDSRAALSRGDWLLAGELGASIPCSPNHARRHFNP